MGATPYRWRLFGGAVAVAVLGSLATLAGLRLFGSVPGALALMLLAAGALGLLAYSAGSAWIAERKANEEAASSRARFQDLVQGLKSVLVWEADPRTFASTFLGGGVAEFGWSGGPEYGGGWDLVPGEDRERLWRALEDARDGKGEQRCLHRAVSPDGRDFWFNTVVHRVDGPRGPVLRGLSMDVTRLRMAEEELRRSEQRYRLLVEGIEDHAIFGLTREGRVASWGRGAERVQGWSEAQVLGQPWDRLFPDVERAKGTPQERLERAAREGRLEEEGWRERADGTRFWADSSISALRGGDGALLGFAAICRDVTERKRGDEVRRLLLGAGQALSGSLDFEETLKRAARIAVPAFADACVLALRREGTVVERLVVEAADPEERERLAAAMAARRGLFPERHGIGRALATGEAELREGVDLELLAEMADTEEQQALLRSVGLRSFITAPLFVHGRVVGAAEFLLTSSGRRYGPRDVEVGVELARRAAMAIENARLFREAQEAVRARDAFLSIASHELKTPLTPFMLQVQGLRRAASRGDGRQVSLQVLAPKLELLERQAQRLGKLITNLLDISRITAGTLSVTREPLELNGLVDRVVERLKPELERAGCEVLLRTDGRIVGNWDRTRLEQVVANLLGNALKYGAGRPVEVGVAAAEGRARVSVRDHGIGIAKEDRVRLFERFERAVSERHYGGFGLGLWSVRQIVNALGGEIAVESEPGRGSVFVVELPIEAQEQAFAERAEEAHAPGGP